MTEMGIQLLRIRDVVKLTALSSSTITRMRNAGQFPQPVKIGSRAVRWRLSDIKAWIESKTSTRPQMLLPGPVPVGPQNRSFIRVLRQYILKSAGHVVRSLLHKVSATFEKIRSRIGLFSRVPQGVGQGCLRDGPRRIRLLQGPVIEAAPEPVNGGTVRQTRRTENVR